VRGVGGQERKGRLALPMESVCHSHSWSLSESLSPLSSSRYLTLASSSDDGHVSHRSPVFGGGLSTSATAAHQGASGREKVNSRASPAIPPAHRQVGHLPKAGKVQHEPFSHAKEEQLRQVVSRFRHFLLRIDPATPSMPTPQLTTPVRPEY